MNFENIVNKINKYHYIIFKGRNTEILGSSNNYEDEFKIIKNSIQKNKKFENQIVAKLELIVISERLIKGNNESKIKTIGGPIEVKIEFYKIINGSLTKIIDCYKNNNIFLTEKFLNENIFDQKISKLIASAAYNNLLKNDLFVLNIIDDLVKN